MESSRQLKFEFEWWFNDIGMNNVYVFTDLVLVMNNQYPNQEELQFKIFLDGSSFVELEVTDEENDVGLGLLLSGRGQVGYFDFRTIE